VTTTLRPAGPQERPDGDGRAGHRRRYDICVDGRRAGGVELSAADENGLRTGRITRLVVDEADRRRGRAGVAALVAEEVLRGWGCSRVSVAVPAAAGPALRLAAALGYTERSRYLLKRVGRPSPGGPPATARLTPPTDEEYLAWRARDRARFVEGLTADGVPRKRAEDGADRALESLLPGGGDTPGMVFRALHLDGAGIGMIWLRLDGAPCSGAEAWVYAVEVAERHRGRGHGRTLMRAAEELCREAGGSVLGLNVHAGNEPARALYESLGYRAVEHHLGKRLR
jgi:GNAT superfamily N-acetyltransferase